MGSSPGSSPSCGSHHAPAPIHSRHQVPQRDRSCPPQIQADWLKETRKKKTSHFRSTSGPLQREREFLACGDPKLLAASSKSFAHNTSKKQWELAHGGSREHKKEGGKTKTRNEEKKGSLIAFCFQDILGACSLPPA